MGFESLRAVLFGVTVALACTAHAQTLFKCTDANKKVTLQDFACRSGTSEAITLQPSRIGTGNARADAAAVANADLRVSRDLALRQYRDANERAMRARSASDSNYQAQRAEEQRIMQEQENCRSQRSFSKYCQDLDAMRQSTIDYQFIQIKAQHEQIYRSALEDRAKAASQLARLGVNVTP